MAAFPIAVGVYTSESPYSLEDALGVFRCYFQQYEAYTGHSHPPLRASQIARIIQDMPWLDDVGKGGTSADIAPGCYPTIIEQHFNARYRRADELSGKMHRSEDVAAIMEDLIYAIRGAFMVLPRRLAVDVCGVKTSAEASEVIRKEVYAVMGGLSQYRYGPKKYEERVRERRRTAIALANDAISGYQKAVSVRDTKIKELRDDLGKQLAGIADRAEALNAAMLQASLTGDRAEMEKAQRDLTELEGQRSQLNARLELLNGKLPRCDEAYAAMNAAVAESEKAVEQYHEDIGIIREFCEKVMQPWMEITAALHHFGEAVSRFYLDCARSHYDSER